MKDAPFNRILVANRAVLGFSASFLTIVIKFNSANLV